jgi:nucleoside-diphosphate-sugar epimerase
LHTKNPPNILNVTGPEHISIRWAAEQMGEILNREPVFLENSAPQKALYSNTAKLNDLMGYPNLPLKSMMNLVVDWVRLGGKTIDAPTHFEAQDGKF